MRLMSSSRSALLIALLLFALSPIWSSAATGSVAPSSPATTTVESSAIIVRFAKNTAESGQPTPSQSQLLIKYGATGVVEALGEPGLFRVTVEKGDDPAAVALALARDPGVAYAEPDRAIRLDDSVAKYQSDTTIAAPIGGSWALNDIHTPQAWALGNGAGVVVAVLDTGVSASHPDLANRVLPGWNFVMNNADASDDAGHGTFVAGLIAASSSSGPIGVAPGASILPVKILDSAGVGSTASFVAGINYAVNVGAKIINLSASGASDSAALNDALANAEAHGVLVVGSAGNDGNEQTSYPAAVPTVLAVSATDQNDKLATFSSFGPYVDIAAPGADISSTWWSVDGGNSHTTASGSSASAPLVSGVAAILAGLRPDASAAMLREILTESARDIETYGIDAQTGFGLLDAQTAVDIAHPPSAPASASLSTAVVDGADHLILNAGGFRSGEALTVWSSASDGFVVHRTFTAGGSGSVSADLGPTWTLPAGSLSVYAVGNDSGYAVSAQHTMTADPASDPFKPIGPVNSTPDRTYFPETGHTLAYGFKQFWEAHGGLAVFGFPISEEFSEQNPDTGQTYTVQYFERNRFEYHPEYAGTPWEVSLGRLGVQIAPQTYPTAPAATGSDALYFGETQHTLSSAFRLYWESHGGVEMFGYPTSEPFEQGGMLVQYFERSRFELHADLPVGSQVLLSRLGVDLARKNSYLH